MTAPKTEKTLLKKESKTPKASSKLPMSGTAKNPSGCCSGTTTCTSGTSAAAPSSIMHTQSNQISDAKKGPKTRIVVKYDVGFNNTITIRGKGAGFSWDRGMGLKNTKADEWVWETEIPFITAEFKVLINDTQYELGENHTLRCGAALQYTPKF